MGLLEQHGKKQDESQLRKDLLHREKDVSEISKVEDFPNRGTSSSDSSPSMIGTCWIYGKTLIWKIKIDVCTEHPHFP